MAKIIVSIMLIIIAVMIGCSDSQSWQVCSPDGNVQVYLTLDKNKSLIYKVKYGDTPAIEASALGVSLSDTDFRSHLTFLGKSEIKPVHDSYTLTSGKELTCTNSGNEVIFSYMNSDNRHISLVVRAYDNGIAFKYLLKSGEGDSSEAAGESTEFNLPVPGKAWMAPYDTIARWAPAYETFYREVDIGTAAPPDKNGWAFPLLFNTNKLWILISEANLTAGYAGMHLQPVCTDGKYTIRFPEIKEADTTCTNKPVFSGTCSTPWRYINISTTPAGIIGSNLTTDLADPSMLNDISWIKPGIASWGWWSDGASARSFQKLKRFVDFSAEMGWRYSLVDAGWDRMEGGDLKELAEYAVSRGVGLLVWYNSGTLNTQNPERASRISNAEQRKAEFKKLHDWGVKGIKVDFFVSDKPYAIQLYHDILKDAAENHLVVNFHGCTLPRGWRRTYPNLLSMEAIRGSEAYRYDRLYPELAPAHLTIAAFTRNVVGPVDYTPTGFSNRQYPHLTTYAFELALGVLFESGITHFCDDVDVYRAMPSYVLDYLKKSPGVWDETRYIAGAPGDFVILGRRNGDNWYLAGINGLREKREVPVDLSFLKGEYQSLELIVDGDTGTTFGHKIIPLGKNKTVAVTMLPFGGFSGIIIK